MITANTTGVFLYQGYWVYVQPSGVCYSALIYKNGKFVGGSYASPLEANDPEQRVVEKAMTKINLKTVRQ